MRPRRDEGWDEKREHERVRCGGTARLLVDTERGLASRAAQLIDISEGGCALRCYKPLPRGSQGWIELEVGGIAVTTSVEVRWVRTDANSWKVGCRFDEPNPFKLAALRALLRHRRERRGRALSHQLVLA